ncbi:MAG: acetyl-CoA carboxylase biotin carboxyl carrier protein subunit [Bacteroidia bacterium]|nr:acetyl-CoA carboxylase biotin carboxyl carrier protein subunit [Bacteroidia bacterium]
MAKIIIDNSSYSIQKTNEATLIDQVEVVYDLLETGDNNYHLIYNRQSFNIEVLNKNTHSGKLTLKINGRVISTQLQNKLADLLKKMGMDNNKKKLKDLKAPMPGLVLEIMVKEGEEVTEGQELIVLEAMKMENAIKSPQDGKIKKIAIKNQDKIDKNHTLLSFE